MLAEKETDYGGGVEQGGPSPQGPLLFMSMVVVSFLLSWYLGSTESLLTDAVQGVRLGMTLLPLLLLVALKLLSTSAAEYGSTDLLGGSWGLLGHDDEEGEEGGSSPWAISVLVILVLFMVWYQPGFLQAWHPLTRN